MGFKFASNISFMFTECPSILGRYKLAREAGFTAVESGFPFGFGIQEIVEAKTAANIDQVLINVFTGDVTKGELGFAAIPGMENDFKKSIELTIEYAKALNCKKIHVMSGKVESPGAANDRVYERNLRYAADRFAAEEILGLIEPINGITVPNYYMNDFEKGMAVIKKINSSNLKLMLDVFHLQHIQGNIAHTIKEYISYIGHVQVAQVPDRHEPDSDGEINYEYVFSQLKKAGYNDYVGLEYKPRSKTAEGLGWIEKFGFSLR